MDEQRRFQTTTAWLGLIGLLLTLVAAFSTGMPPAPDASASTIAAFLSDHRSAFLLGAILYTLAAPLLLLSIIGVVSWLRRTTRVTGGLVSDVGTFAVVATAIAVTFQLFNAMFNTAMAYKVEGLLRDEPGLLRLWFDFPVFLFSGVFFGAAIAALAWLLGRRDSGVTPGTRSIMLIAGYVIAGFNVVPVLAYLSK